MYDGDLPRLANTIKMLFPNDILGPWDPHISATWPLDRCSCFLWHQLPNDGDSISGPKWPTTDFCDVSSQHSQSALSTPPMPRHLKLSILAVKSMLNNDCTFLSEHDHPGNLFSNPFPRSRIMPPPYMGNPGLKLSWGPECCPAGTKR